MQTLISPSSYPRQRMTLIALWCGVLILSATAWSFRLVSFLHAKDMVVAAGLIPALVMQLYWRGVPMRGVKTLAPLWYGWLFWSVAGLFTSQVLPYHVESAARLALVLLAASLATELFVVEQARPWLYRAFIASGAVVGALALLQYCGMIEMLLPTFPGYDQRAYSVFGNQNLLGGYMAVQLTLLTALHVRRRRSTRAWLFAHAVVYSILLGALLASATRTAWLAAALGCAWTALSMAYTAGWRGTLKRWRDNGFLMIIALTLAALLASAPYIIARLAVTYSADDVGGHARLWFWAGAVRMIADNPLFGVGLGNYGFWSPLYQGVALWAQGGEHFYHNELHTVHAHSEILEWMAETGLVGVFFWGWFIIAVARRRNPATPALITLLVFACFNTVSHSTPHLLAGLLLAAVHRRESEPAPENKRGGGRVAVLAAAVLLVGVFGATTLVPSALLCRAEQTHIGGTDPKPLYLRAIAWPWPSFQAHENYAIALLDVDRFEEARTQLEKARHGRDTGSIHLLLAICAEARGDRAAVAEHAWACLQRWPANQHAWALTLANAPPEVVAELETARQRFLAP